MDNIERAQVLERLSLLERASVDFADQDFTLECHHLIDDAAALLLPSQSTLTELARATRAAQARSPRLVCHIVRALLAR